MTILRGNNDRVNVTSLKDGVEALNKLDGMATSSRQAGEILHANNTALPAMVYFVYDKSLGSRINVDLNMYEYNLECAYAERRYMVITASLLSNLLRSTYLRVSLQKSEY